MADRSVRAVSAWEGKIVRAALLDSVRKLDPRLMARNPVMFVVEIGSVLTTLIWLRAPALFTGQVALWLWFTVLFANFAEALAEGRGKAQAAALRGMRQETVARKRVNGREERGDRLRGRVGRDRRVRPRHPRERR
jgi:potassium-transporting ATPase ATP-binding subunit